MSVSIKDVKKGTRVKLQNGWEAIVEDNCVNQHTRVCTVFGWETEMGSVYSTDIVAVIRPDGYDKVEHTMGQMKGKANRTAMGW